MIGNKKPTTNRPSDMRCTANASALLFEDIDNYKPSRKTLGLELVASEELLAKNSDWNFASSKYSGIESTTSESNSNSDRRGAQKQKQATAKSMTAVATKMTTTIRCFLASSQELPSKKKMTLDGKNTSYDGIVLSDPEKVMTSSTTSATTIRRLEASDRDTPSIFANVRKNRRRKPEQSRRNDARFDVSFDGNVKIIDALEGSFSNRDTSIIDCTFGKDTHPDQIEVADDDSFMQGQAFDSAFNFSVVGAATNIEGNISGKNTEQEQIEVTDDDNFYSERRTFDNDFRSSIAGVDAVAVNSNGADKSDVDTTTSTAPSSSPVSISRNESSASGLSNDDGRSHLLSPAIVHGGATLATINVRDYFCSPIVSSSEIHQLLRTGSFMEYSNDTTPVLDSPTSFSMTMKSEFSNESPTGVEGLTLSEHHQGRDSDSNIIVDGKEDNARGIIIYDNGDDDDDVSVGTQKTVNTCNTSMISRRRSSSITLQKTRQVHFDNGEEEDIRYYARVNELKSGNIGYSSACSKISEGGLESKQIKDDVNVHVDQEKTESMESSTTDNDLSTAIHPTSDNFPDGITKLLEKCFFVNNTNDSSLEAMVLSPATPIIKDHSKAMTVDEQPLKSFYPPQIHRNLKPIDLFQAKDHSACGVLRNVFRKESLADDSKSRFEDDDTTSTMDSAVFTITSKETMDSSSIHTDELNDNARSGCNPIPSWFDNGFHDVMDKMDNALNGCTKNADDDCSEAPYDEEDYDDIKDDTDDEEELSVRGRRSMHNRSRSRHRYQQARTRNTISRASSGEYRVRFVSPARNEADGSIRSGGYGSNVILPSMSNSMILVEHRQLHDSASQKEIIANGALDAQQQDIAAQRGKFGPYRSYAEEKKKRRFRMKRV